MSNNDYKKIDWRLKKEEVTSLIIGAVLSNFTIILTIKGLTVVAMLASAIYVIFALKKDNFHSLCFITLSVSNTHVLNIFGVSAAVLICCGVVIKYLIEGNRINNSFVLVTCIYLLYSFQFVLRFDDYSSGLISPIKLVFVYAAFSIFSKSNDVIDKIYVLPGKVAKFGAMGCFTNLVVSMLLIKSNRARIANNDSNILAVEAVVYICIFIVGYFRFNAISILDLIAMMFSMGGIVLLCGSRNGFLLLAITIMFSVVFNYNKIGKVSMLGFIVVIISCFLATTEMGESALSVFKTRTEVLSSKGDISNGRMDIWMQYIAKFNETKMGWLLGFGKYTNVGLDEMGHNGLIEDIANYGLIGIVIILLFISVIIRQLNKHYTIRLLSFNALPILIIVIGSFTLRSLTNIINTTLLFSCLMLSLDKSKKRKIDGFSVRQNKNT